jgi:uncharacterized protein YcbK (DUF882 family)
MDGEFMGRLEDLRVKVGRALYISSGYRCMEHNRAVGGSSRSFHVVGRAADIVCENSEERYELVGAAIRLGLGGIGVDKMFVHVDNRRSQPRKIWTY